MAQIYISVGTNVNRQQNIHFCLQKIYAHWQKINLSSLYDTQAVGFSGNNFYNMVIGFETDETIEHIVDILKNIEVQAGRQQNIEKFSDRTLDLDLLTYDDKVCQEPIVLPRPEILYHAFVLLPFSELAPDWIHPEMNQSLQVLWEAFDADNQSITKVDDLETMKSFRRESMLTQKHIVKKEDSIR